MSTTVGELNIKLNLELARLDAQIKQSNQKIATMGKRMNSDIARAARAINVTLGSLGVGVGVGALTKFGKEILDLGGKINDLSNQAGLSTDAFQTLAAAGKESGVTGDQIASAFNKMSQTIQDAAEGSKSAVDSLGKLKLTAAGLKALKPEEQFTLIAMQIQAAEDKSKAFNASLDILGSKNAPKLKEVLQRLGTEGFGALSKSTEKVRFTPEQIKTLDEAGDALQQMADAITVIAAKAALFFGKKEGNPAQSVAASGAYNPAVGIGGRSVTQQRNLEGLYSGEPDPTSRSISPEQVETLNEAARLREVTRAAEEAQGEIDALNQRFTELDKQNAASSNAFYIWITEREAQLKASSDAQESMRKKRAAGENSFNVALANSFKDVQAAVAATDDAWGEYAESIKDAVDPMRVFNREMEKLIALKSQGVLTDGQFETATKQLGDRVLPKPADVTAEWSVFQKQMFEIFNSVGDRAAATFADMVIDGENAFKSLATVAAKAILEMAARLAVINPLLNMVFGLGGTNAALPTITTAFGGAKASGGPVDAGKGYIVGERGPEWFSPRTNGTIIPNHLLDGGGGNSTDVTNITYNIQAGVSRAELIPILKQHAEATIGEGRRRERLRK